MERVYVGNLPPDIRIKDIDDFFRAFGKLVYIDVNHRANPVYALVQFDSARNAFNAVKARHGYDYEGYTLQLRLVENEVRKRRDATPPPPPPPMFSDFNSQNSRGGFNNNNNNSNNNNNNNRMGGNFANSNSYQSSSNSQWSGNNRQGMSQGMQQQQQQQNNRVNMPQQNMMDYQPNNRSNNMQQQNMMMPYSSNNGGGIGGRSNMQQNNNSNRSNIQQQQFSNSNRSNIQQQYSNTSNRSNNQQFSNYNRSDMPQQQNMNNYSNMSHQNMMNYSNSNPNYSNMSQQQQQQNMNMMDYSNNSSWNSGINNNMMNNMGWNSGNNMNSGVNNNYNNMNSGVNNNYNNNNAPPANYNYNSNNDPYARPGFEDSFTRGLSGSGRKWFNRYIRKGFSPEMARNKALEHRTQPYPRDNVPNNINNSNNNNAINPIPNDPTNVALETIGNTILSLLSTNPADNFNNDNQMMPSFSNWGGDNFQGGFNNNVGGNFDMPGPSSSRGNIMSQSPVRGQQSRNRVSRQQYLKSLDTLKRLRGKREQSSKDRLSKKYHTQIVKDYEQYEKSMSTARPPRVITTSSNPRNDKQIAAIAAQGKSYTELSIALRKKKQQLFLAAKRLGNDAANKRYGGAYKKRMRILMDESGFDVLEAKALAVHPLEKLQPLMALKAECDQALKKKQDSFSIVKKITNRSSKNVAYRQDINFLQKFEKQRIENLSPRLKMAIRACLTRIHKHEKEAHKPLTKSKFVRLLPKKTGQKPTTSKGATTTSNTKKTAAGTSKTKAAAATNTNTKKVENKDNASENKETTKKDAASEKPQEKEKVSAKSVSADKPKPADKKET